LNAIRNWSECRLATMLFRSYGYKAISTVVSYRTGMTLRRFHSNCWIQSARLPDGAGGGTNYLWLWYTKAHGYIVSQRIWKMKRLRVEEWNGAKYVYAWGDAVSTGVGH
jgi:hypothetical protein